VQPSLDEALKIMSAFAFELGNFVCSVRTWRKSRWSCYLSEEITAWPGRVLSNRELTQLSVIVFRIAIVLDSYETFVNANSFLATPRNSIISILDWVVQTAIKTLLTLQTGKCYSSFIYRNVVVRRDSGINKLFCRVRDLTLICFCLHVILLFLTIAFFIQRNFLFIVFRVRKSRHYFQTERISSIILNMFWGEIW
jgi:hypothetical protein